MKKIEKINLKWNRVLGVAEGLNELNKLNITEIMDFAQDVQEKANQMFRNFYNKSKFGDD